MIHTPLNYSSAEQWAGFPHTPGDGGRERGEQKKKKKKREQGGGDGRIDE